MTGWFENGWKSGYQRLEKRLGGNFWQYKAVGGMLGADGGPQLHHTMVALKLQQFQCNRKKDFLRRLWRLGYPMLFKGSDAPHPPPPRGGLQGGYNTYALRV